MSIMSIIYGPVPSWRLGRSLGIDMLSTNGKTCSFDCIYCQLGRTDHPLTTRREFVTTDKLSEELKKVIGTPADYATFSGVGEPTLASNLDEAIKLAKEILHLPAAVLTNSSLINMEDVRRDLSLADVVVAKMDAPDEEIFRKINQPIGEQTLTQIIQGLKQFRQQYQGRLALQMMFVDINKEYAPQMARIARDIDPDEVQINTPLRPSRVKPLTDAELAAIKEEFSGLPRVVTVFEAPHPEVTPLDAAETLRRRPS